MHFFELRGVRRKWLFENGIICMEYDISSRYSWRSPCIWSGYQLFPLRIVATVEPNWLENVIDRVE